MNTVRINGQDYTSSLSDAEIAFMGNFSLPTTAQTLSGAIAEHETDISELNSNLSALSGISLTYKGRVTTNNSDYLVDSGIWYNDTVLQYSIPSFSINYSHIIVLNYGGIITQIAINAGTNMAIRKRSGSPATWSQWINIK